MINPVSQASALNPGSDLWVVTDLSHSRWTAKLDWYLNLQIVKASRHEPPKISSFLTEAVEKTGLKSPEIQLPPSAPLLIQSETLLPNKWVLVLPFQNDLEVWIEKVMTIWQQLQKPSLRIFLPSGQNASSVKESWLKRFDSKEVSLVLDLSH